MHTINRKKAQLSVAAVAALAIFAVAAVMLLAGGFNTSPAQAQAGPGETPKLCGPGQSLDNYPDEPAEEKSRGHYALFDAYWLPGESLGDDVNDGTLNNNLCPPSASHKDVKTGRGKTVEVTTLTPSDIDLRSTIIHVEDKHKAFVKETTAKKDKTNLSLEKYRSLGRALGLSDGDSVPEGTEVYWLRLEDPDLGTEASDLVLGFSAGQFDEKDWYREDEGTSVKPLQYELEAMRYYGTHAADLPHVLTYWEPELGRGLVWNTYDTDVNTMPVWAGEYEHLEWVFTHPGTYVLEVHIKGHVRQKKPTGAGTDWDGWEKITDEDTTITSEVREYTIHVGPLTVNESPAFGVMRSVEENSAGGTKVGDPIKIFTNDNDALNYSLAGVGAGKFNVVSVDDGAQITVADGAALDYEGKRTYDLVLSVSDGKDHENNPERVATVDDTIVVQVTLIDVPPSIALNVPTSDPRVGDTVTIRASYLELQGYAPDSAIWSIRFLNNDGLPEPTDSMYLSADDHGEYDLTATEAGKKDYEVVLQYNIQGSSHLQSLKAKFSINWLAASP